MSNALGIGTTGLNASQRQMDVIGNNLANASTIGFKAAETQFADMLSHSLNGGGNGNMQVGQGVSISSVSTRFDQGSFESTGSVMDMAIDGEGFFPVKDKEGALFYTRAGAFHIDKEGFLVDVNGYRVQGLNLFATTGNDEITDICLQNIQSSPSASKTFGIGVNLNDSDENDTQFVASQNVFDSKGEIHNLSLNFTKTDAGKWSCQATLDEVPATAQSITEITFDENGKLDGIGADPTFTFAALPNGATIGDGGVLTWDLTSEDSPQVTGYAATSVIKTLEVDGYPSGVLKTLNLAKNGVISGIFTNGQTSDLGQVVLANFPNVEGMTRIGSYFGETNVSGAAIINKPGTGGLGEVMSNSLEQSNVDVSKEFVNMINAQKAYQANARIITAADEMLTELMNIKR